MSHRFSSQSLHSMACSSSLYYYVKSASSCTPIRIWLNTAVGRAREILCPDSHFLAHRFLFHPSLGYYSQSDQLRKKTMKIFILNDSLEHNRIGVGGVELLFKWLKKNSSGWLANFLLDELMSVASPTEWRRWRDSPDSKKRTRRFLSLCGIKWIEGKS